MRPLALLRIGFVAVVLLALTVSLAGIVLTGPVTVVREPQMDTGVRASPERLRRDVETICGDFSPRSWEHVENLSRLADWIERAFDDSGLQIERQEYPASGRVFRNVIGSRPGNDPEAGTIVIGAHYDAYADFPGADDNASGVAVLIELARTLPKVAHARHHLFVAFGTEEPPHFRSDGMGSHAFARRLLDDGVAVELMISLDLVGYYSDEPHSQRFPSKVLELFYPDRGDFVAVVGDLRSGSWLARVKRGMRSASELPVHSLRAPARWAPIDLSDHLSFRQLGLPGVLVTDTAFMRYPYYHSREDTPDRLDYRRMAMLVEALHGVLWEGAGPAI